MWNPMVRGSMDNLYKNSLYSGQTSDLKKVNKNFNGKTPKNNGNKPVHIWFPSDS